MIAVVSLLALCIAGLAVTAYYQWRIVLAQALQTRATSKLAAAVDKLLDGLPKRLYGMDAPDIMAQRRQP